MARTTRRREPSEVVNTKRSIKKNFRRVNRKNSKRKLQEINSTDPQSWDDFDIDENYVRGFY